MLGFGFKNMLYFKLVFGAEVPCRKRTALKTNLRMQKWFLYRAESKRSALWEESAVLATISQLLMPCTGIFQIWC